MITRRIVALSALIALMLLPLTAAQALRIYFIDTEGVQATLVVTPRGESLLIDAGFPGDGRFSSKPGDPAQARDANRILAAVKDAGVSRIDYFVLSHAHADHSGGITELAAQLPIGTFVDNGGPLPNADAVAGTLTAQSARGGPRLGSRPMASTMRRLNLSTIPLVCGRYDLVRR